VTYFPLRGLYHNLSARGSLVFCPAQRDSYILTLGFLGKQSFRTASHFPCSIGLDFSPVCKESNLRVYGSFHGCVDLLLVARVIFVSFLTIFVGFSCATCSLCIFVLDHDPSNSKFILQLKDFGWNPSCCAGLRFDSRRFSSFEGSSFGAYHLLGTLHIFPKSFLKRSKPFWRSIDQ
jgi:hypothetical protein